MRRWYAPAAAARRPGVRRSECGDAARVGGLGRAGRRVGCHRLDKAACTSQHGGVARSDGWSATEPLRRDFFDADGATSHEQLLPAAGRQAHRPAGPRADHRDVVRSPRHGGPLPQPVRRERAPAGVPGRAPGVPRSRPQELRRWHGSAGSRGVSPETLLDQHVLPAHQLREPGQGIWSRTPPAATTPTTPGDRPRPRSRTAATSTADLRLRHHPVPREPTARSTPAATRRRCRPRRRSARRASPTSSPRSPTPTARGSVPFEVRTASRTSRWAAPTVPCTLDVIPINGINCDKPTPPAALQPDRRPPARAGQPRPGAAGRGRTGVLGVGLELGPPGPGPAHLRPAAERLHRRDSRASRSVLRLRAARPGRAAVDPGVLPEQEAVQLRRSTRCPTTRRSSLMESGEAAAAEVSRASASDADVGYAPTAVDRLRDRLRHRQARQRRPVHRPQAQRPAARQAAHRVLSRLDDRRREPPGLRAATRLSLNLDPDFIGSTPGWTHALVGGRRDAAVDVDHAPTVMDAADAPTSPPTRRRWPSSTASRTTWAVHDAGQPGVPGHQAAGGLLAAARHLAVRRPRPNPCLQAQGTPCRRTCP